MSCRGSIGRPSAKRHQICLDSSSQRVHNDANADDFARSNKRRKLLRSKIIEGVLVVPFRLDATLVLVIVDRVRRRVPRNPIHRYGCLETFSRSQPSAEKGSGSIASATPDFLPPPTTIHSFLTLNSVRTSTISSTPTGKVALQYRRGMSPPLVNLVVFLLIKRGRSSIAIFAPLVFVSGDLDYIPFDINNTLSMGLHFRAIASKISG